MTIIPDPENPDRFAIDEDGQMMFAVYAMPMPDDGTTPSLNEFEKHAVHVGWSNGKLNNKEET